MNRRYSSPPDNKGCPNQEELKEFFTDPLLRKKNNPTKNANAKKTIPCSSDPEESSSNDPEAAKPTVKVSPDDATSNLGSIYPVVYGDIDYDGLFEIVIEGKVVIRVADPTTIPANNLMTRRITIAGGFLDIALFTANCEQLKFVLELGDLHIYYHQVAGLLITSLVLQLLFGLTMFLLGCQVFQKVSEDEIYLNFLNHTAMGLVALITIVNIFVGTFGPKGTVMARCLGSFAYPKAYGPVWMEYLNATKNYMGDVVK